MPSLVSIFNKALGHVGAARIINASDKNNRAEICNDMYEFALSMTLEAREWTFATRRLRLLPDPTVTPPWGYDFGYRLPNNVLRVTEVWNGRFRQNMRWEVEGDLLYATQGSIDIKFIELVTDTTRFSPKFSEALAIKLAADICVPLTENVSLFGALESLYEKKIGEAAALDGLQATRERLRSDRLINARSRSTMFGSEDDSFQTGTGSYLDTTTPPVVVPPSGTIAGPASAAIGDSVTFTSTILGGTQPITYQWIKNGLSIDGAIFNNYTIPSVEEGDAANYSCAFSNTGGTVISNVVSFEVGCFAPVSTITGPSSVVEGGSFTMVGNLLAGNTPVTYQWQKDSVDIVGATNSTYTVTTSTTGDTGVYTLLVSNACATDEPSTNSISLNVTPIAAPVISIDPTSISPLVPQTASFTATVDNDGGDPNVTWQWYLDGNPTGANIPTYTTPITQDGVNWTVSVTATNSAGVSNEPTASVTPVSNLISETAFAVDDTLVLDAECAWVEAQGCGGGGAGGGQQFSSGVFGPHTGGGGGGAALVAILSSAAVGGGTATVVVGDGGAGSASDGVAGTNSSVSGAGVIGLSWSGGKGGKKGISGTTPGGSGGNSSAGLGAGAGGAGTNDDGDNGTNGGGGGGGSTASSGQAGVKSGRGGNGGGSNGGVGGSLRDQILKGTGGGGGGNDAVWWDGTAQGNGGDGYKYPTGDGVPAGDGTGKGNAGGGGGGGGEEIGGGGGGVGVSIGGDGAPGYVIIRQYRQQP